MYYSLIVAFAALTHQPGYDNTREKNTLHGSESQLEI